MKAGNSRIRKSIPLILIAILFCPVVYGKVIYVDDDAAGANDGTSWENAYVYLQEALADANSSEKPVEILVAQGIYKPNGGLVAIPEFDWRTTTFQLINSVALKGGYAGFGDTDPNARDIKAYETILSGDLNGDDIEVVNLKDLLDEPTRADNSYHVVTGSGTDETSVLDGFTIVAGNANGGPSHGTGGGMKNQSGSPRITNCKFSWNSAIFAGGVDNDRSNPILINCDFCKNYATAGGGMNNLHCTPTLINCIFYGNSAMKGGGIENINSNSILTNCTFSENTILLGSGAVLNLGSKPILTNCILWGNSSDQIDPRAIITYSNIQGGWEGEGNIDTDPLFADPDKGDYHLKSQAGRWDPNSESWVVDDVTSPCIDAGDPNSPVGDEPEPNGSRINMGAYGGTAEASKSGVSWWFETTQGPIAAEGLGVILPHEHIFTDLRGPGTRGYGQADTADVVRVMAPLLEEAKQKGVGLLVECSSIGVGRNVSILSEVSATSGLPVVVPTGVYGRANFAPTEHKNMSEDELTELFISEIRDGIEDTGIRAGFIKIATGGSNMTALEEKFLRAAGRAARETGAAVASHTNTSNNVTRQADILESISPEIRFIWVHAQSVNNRSLYRQLAERGVFIEFDSLGWNPGQDSTFIMAIKDLLSGGYGEQILLSHDAGWYRPGEKNGGTQMPYTYLIETFIPKLRDNGVDDESIQMITEINPIRAFGFNQDVNP
ncbi:MAG: hypothetical protein GY774_16055 [Planctomycetes bacterium]|nr:hypothetical protein [Planctomycetota bacterium]